MKKRSQYSLIIEENIRKYYNFYQLIFQKISDYHLNQHYQCSKKFCRCEERLLKQ